MAMRGWSKGTGGGYVANVYLVVVAGVVAAGLVACGDTAAAPSARTPTATVRATATAAAPAFTFSSRPLGAALRHRVRGTSWHPGCPVGLGGLRYLRVGFWGFDRRRHVGELVVASSAVPAIRQAFAELYHVRFPIRRMRLVDDYGGSDYASIEADNTSAFNCRPVTGGSRFSEHAYGRAIDVNPIENPYVYPDGTTSHKASRPYLNRARHRRGMAYPGGALVRAFTAARWGWGGAWRRPSATDYQHFSATGR